MVEGNNNVIENLFAVPNRTAGIELNNAKNNIIAGFFAYSNQNYGLWIKQSSNNQIFSNFYNNTNIGLYVGCSDNGPVLEKCKGVGASKGNSIYETGARNNGNYGIVIDLGNTQNFVTDDASSGNSIADLFDGNGNCDQNTWLVNGFDTSNPNCIH